MSSTHRSPDAIVRILAALADPVRLDIVRQLSLGEDVCACDFDVHPKVTQPTISHHLRVLREAGVVCAERRGIHVHYTLDPTAVDRLAAIARSLGPPTHDVHDARAGQRLPLAVPGVVVADHDGSTPASRRSGRREVTFDPRG